MYGYDSRVRLSEVDQDRRMTLNAIRGTEKADVGVKFLEDSDSEISGAGRVHSG